MKKLILVTALLFGSLMIVNAGEDKYTIGEKMSFKSEVLNEERSVLVYTPQTYDLSSQSYPVMYLLDGGTHFHHVSGIVQFLAGNGIIPEMIVVAVVNVDRTRDFTPTNEKEWPNTGGASKFMNYLKDELMPFVDKNFRTQPYDILVGHSLGGLFAAYSLLDYPDVFNSYIAISPYLMFDNDSLVKQASTKLLDKYNHAQFYMTIGNEPDYFETLSEFQNSIESKSPEGLKFNYVKMDKENHGSSPHLAVYNGLEWIYSGWNLSKETFSEGLAAVDKHYKVLSKKFGYEIPTSELTINALGYYYMNNNEYTEAIMIFQENVKRYPQSSNVYDSLGEAYEKNDQLAEAEKNYEKAVKIAEKENHPNLKIYTANMERAQKELAQE